MVRRLASFLVAYIAHGVIVGLEASALTLVLAVDDASARSSGVLRNPVDRERRMKVGD